MSIELNDDEIIKIGKLHNELMHRFFQKKFDVVTDSLFIREMFRTEFDKIGYAVDVSLERMTDDFGCPTDYWQPVLDIIGRSGVVGEAYDKAILTETDWERKQYDAKKHTVEELDEKAFGNAEKLID